MTILHNARKAYNTWKRLGWQVLRQKIGKKIAGTDGQDDYRYQGMIYASWLDFSSQDIEASKQLHELHKGKQDIRSLTWFLPEFENPYYGGVYTLLRFADYFKRTKGVQNHFTILGTMEDHRTSEKIAGAFPALAGEPVRHFHLYEHIDDFEATDAAIATLWGTAYFLLRFNQTRRKFYFLQDYEPLFYPAGSISAQVEASLRFGFYGIANTPTIQQIYEEQYGGRAEFFYPCVDTQIFYPTTMEEDAAFSAAAEGALTEEPFRIFFYGRPNHMRNGFDLGAEALRSLKKKYGSKIHIVSAGDDWDEHNYNLDGVVENLGLLTYQQTAELYRTCHAGLVMMFTRHPSYLPFELMASGSLVVTNYNPATTWFLKDGENCRLANTSATCIAEVLEQAYLNREQRERITQRAVQEIRSDFSNWDRQIEKIYTYMLDPDTNRPATSRG